MLFFCRSENIKASSFFFLPFGQAAQSFSLSSEIRAVGEQGSSMSPEVCRKRVRTVAGAGAGAKVGVADFDDDDDDDVIASVFFLLCKEGCSLFFSVVSSLSFPRRRQAESESSTRALL